MTRHWRPVTVKLPRPLDEALRRYCDERIETAGPPVVELLAQLDDELRQHAASV